MVEDSHVTWYSHTECIIQHSIATLVKKLFTSSAPLLRLVHFILQTTSYALSLFFGFFVFSPLHFLFISFGEVFDVSFDSV